MDAALKDKIINAETEKQLKRSVDEFQKAYNSEKEKTERLIKILRIAAIVLGVLIIAVSILKYIISILRGNSQFY